MSILRNTVVLVTGASSGIGAATAVRLAADGATVAIVGRRRERLEQVASKIRAEGGTALVLQLDITQKEQAVRIVDETLANLGRLDTLVNNAGIMLLGPALGSPIDEWEQMVRLNVLGTLWVTHAALPYLTRAARDSARGVADIVNISSTAGRVARPGASVYSLSKFGLAAFSESLRQEMIPHRVRVSVIEPGTVDTELASHVRDEVRDAIDRQVLAIQTLCPDDIADAVSYVVTRPRHVAANEVLIRAAEQTW